MEYVFIALGIAILVGLYTWSYSVNDKCEKPEGTIEPGCSSCHSKSCNTRQNEIKQ